MSNSFEKGLNQFSLPPAVCEMERTFIDAEHVPGTGLGAL